jgi:hypothetical protein
MNETHSPFRSADARESRGPAGDDAPTPALTAHMMLILRDYLLRRQAPGLTPLDET